MQPHDRSQESEGIYPQQRLNVSICTTTARRGFVEHQARMIARQNCSGHKLEWVLIDFAYEERADMISRLASELNLTIVHAPNVRDNQKLFRDIVRNRNKALMLASGDVVIFLDDYAVIPQDFVARHMGVLSTGSISAGNMYRLESTITDFDGLAEHAFSTLLDLYPHVIGLDSRFLRGGIKVDRPYRAVGISYTGNLGIPRQVFECLNGFDPRMDSGLEDSDLGIRAYGAGLTCFFNPHACTLNLCTGHVPYTFQYDHVHDVEPFISNSVNKYWGNAKLPENEFLTVEFKDHYRVARCKRCGATGMIDPTELMDYKRQLPGGQTRVPEGLPGGLDTLRKEVEDDLRSKLYAPDGKEPRS